LPLLESSPPSCWRYSLPPKKRAERTTCLNNLRQVNLGIRMYSDDSSDATPSPGISATSTNHLPLFSAYKELMKNYVGLKAAPSAHDKLFACPADKFFPSYVYVTNTGWYYVRESLHDDPVLDYSSYAFNGGDNVTRTFGLTNHYTMPGLTGVKFVRSNIPRGPSLSRRHRPSLLGHGTNHRPASCSTMPKTWPALWMAT